MPAWIVPFLIRYVLPFILQAAYKSGLINLVEREIIKFGMSLKTYHDPDDFPLKPPRVNVNRNFNKDQ